MTIVLSHALWIWGLAVFLILFALQAVFHVAIPELLLGIVALLTALAIFIQIGPSKAAP